MKLQNLLMTTALVATALTACNTSKVAVEKNGTVKTETAVQTEAAIHKVLFGTWTVTTVGGQNVNGENRPYVELGEDASNPFLVKCYAFNGCNYVNGTYAAQQGGKLTPTSNFISTMRMCEDAPYEIGVSLALNNVTGYTLTQVGTGYTLTFNNAQGQTLMTMTKVATEYINGAWDVTSIGGASVDENLDLRLVIDLNTQSIHGNAGCNTLNGKIVTNPDVANSISFTQLITTRMTCPAIATEQALIQALSSVTNVVPGETANSAVLRNAEGNAVVTLQRSNI